MYAAEIDEFEFYAFFDGFGKSLAHKFRNDYRDVIFTAILVGELYQIDTGVLQGIVRALAKKVETSSWTHSGRGEVALCALDNLCDDLEVKA